MQGVRSRHPGEMRADIRVKEKVRHPKTWPPGQAQNGDAGILGTNY